MKRVTPPAKNMPLKHRNKQQGVGGAEHVAVFLLWCHTIGQKAQQVLFQAWHGNYQKCLLRIKIWHLFHNTTSEFHWIGWIELFPCQKTWQMSSNTRDSADIEEKIAENGIFDITVPLRNSASIYFDNNIQYVSSLSGTDRSLSRRP